MSYPAPSGSSIFFASLPFLFLIMYVLFGITFEPNSVINYQISLKENHYWYFISLMTAILTMVIGLILSLKAGGAIPVTMFFEQKLYEKARRRRETYHRLLLLSKIFFSIAVICIISCSFLLIQFGPTLTKAFFTFLACFPIISFVDGTELGRSNRFDCLMFDFGLCILLLLCIPAWFTLSY